MTLDWRHKPVLPAALYRRPRWYRDASSPLLVAVLLGFLVFLLITMAIRNGP